MSRFVGMAAALSCSQLRYRGLPILKLYMDRLWGLFWINPELPYQTSPSQ